MPLTKKQQLLLLRSLTPAQKAKIRAVCRRCQTQHVGKGQMGTGVFSSLFKSIKKGVKAVVKSPIFKEVGNLALHEFILPMLKQKISGKGLTLSGSGRKKPCKKKRGGSLKLAGSGGRKSKQSKHLPPSLY